MDTSTLFARMNTSRLARGLRTLEEIEALMETGVDILDPFSTLISLDVEIGAGTVLLPNVALIAGPSGSLRLGSGNVLHSGAVIEASQGEIRIGDGNEIGEGGGGFKANRPGSAISVGDGGRYIGGCQVFGRSALGSGSQILGPITVDGCQLEAGGTWQDADPDQRAGLLKGSGLARGLTVPRGHVIAGNGTFRMEDMKPQSFYHPKS
jgi:carbonic anhydrase/acetyltransferase-like protein (isoleucine patch superfamily)